MKRAFLFALAVLAAAPVVLAGTAGPEGEFSMVAHVDTKDGTRSLACTIRVTRPMPYSEAAPLRKLLEHGGQQAVLNAIRGASRGMLSLGGVEYPLDLVIFEPKGRGFRYVVVTARWVRWEETTEGHDSLDYPFSIAVFESPSTGLGDGQICPRAALEIDEEGHAYAAAYEGRVGVLKEVRRR
jgi:hypothetical protein